MFIDLARRGLLIAYGSITRTAQAVSESVDRGAP